MRCSLFDLARDTIEAAREDTARLVPVHSEVDRSRARRDLIVVPIVTIGLVAMPFYVMEKLPSTAWGDYYKYIVAVCAIGAFALSGILTPIINAYLAFKGKWDKVNKEADK